MAVPNRLKTLREERGWTQVKVRQQIRLFALAKGVSVANSDSLKAMYSGWENKHHLPDAHYRELLCLVFGVPESQLLGAGGGPSEEDDPASELRRRLLVSGATDSATVALFQAQTDRIRMIDRRMGARASADQMAAHLASLQTQLSHTVFLDQRRPLAVVLSDAAALAAWQALDLGDVSSAWQHYETAKAAREAESRTLLAHAMASQAYVVLDLNQPQLGLDLVREACAIAGSSVPALLSSWLRAVEAELCAAAGLRRDCYHGFDEAARRLPPDVEDPELPYLMLSDGHLSRWRGNAFAKLGDDRAIDELYAALNDTAPTSARAEASLRCDLAHVLMVAGHRDEARIQADKAAELVALLGSVRQRRRLARVRAA